MTPNKAKRKGTDWERQAVDLLNELTGGEWKRIPGSGAIGTIMNESGLQGDIKGMLNFTDIPFKLEAKTGYGGAKQLAVKKEWLDKIREEAEASYSIPGLICKFSNAKSGAKHFIVFDLDAFAKIVKEAEVLNKMLLDALDDSE